jgi:hypothetical protein
MGWWPAMYVRAAFVCSFHQRLFVVVSVSERNRAAQSFETSESEMHPTHSDGRYF